MGATGVSPVISEIGALWEISALWANGAEAGGLPRFDSPLAGEGRIGPNRTRAKSIKATAPYIALLIIDILLFSKDLSIVPSIAVPRQCESMFEVLLWGRRHFLPIQGTLQRERCHALAT